MSSSSSEHTHFVSFFVSSSPLLSMTVLKYLISMYSDRQLMVTRRRERVGGTETEFYQSSTSSRVNAFITNCQRYNTMLTFLPFSLSLSYLPACKNIVHHSIRHEWWWHSSIILLLLLPRSSCWYISNGWERRERGKKDKYAYRIDGIGACGIANKRTPVNILQSNSWQLCILPTGFNR